MIDLTKPVQTRDGRKVEIFKTDRRHSIYPVVGLVDCGEHGEEFSAWTADGRRFVDMQMSSDLVNTPEEKTLDCWVNVYPNNVSCDSCRLSKKDADNFAGLGRIACIHIVQKFTVGEGL